jgi:hypothetical protein
VLLNDGKGRFTDVTDQKAPFLRKFGLVTSCVPMDANKDGWADLVVTGEWMPVTVLLNSQGVLQPQPDAAGAGKSGWWNRLTAEDLDNDGDLDVVAGNFGWNCQMKPTEKEPVTLVYGDFDQNEAVDPFVCYYVGGKSYPLVNRDEALNQVFALRRKFTNYESYAEASLTDMFTPEQLEGAATLSATTFSSVILENKGDGTFAAHELPVEAQMSPVYAIALLDVDKDGLKDLIVGGNQSHTRIKLSKMDANYGMLFRNGGQFNFTYVPQWKSGLAVKGDVRDITVIKLGTGTVLLFSRNNDTIKGYQLNP